jgi:hypothetical protein
MTDRQTDTHTHGALLEIDFLIAGVLIILEQNKDGWDGTKVAFTER